MHRLFLLVSVFLALGNFVAPAADDKDECRRSDDAAIMANLCGSAILSGQYRGHDLADLHQQRARGLIRQALPADQNTTKRYDDAIASLGEAISIVLAEGGTDRNRLREAYYWRAYVFIEKKEFERAIADLNEAIKYKPADAFAFFLRGDAYLGKGEADRAIADFGDAIRLDPKQVTAHSTAYENRALAYELKGEIDKALAEARRADNAAKASRHLRPTALIKRLEQKLAAGGAKAPPIAVAAPAPNAAAPAPPVATPAIAAAPAPSSPPVPVQRAQPAPSVTSAPPPVAAAPPSAPAASPAPREMRVALVIGNSKYRSATPLTNPANDAADVAKALRGLGFEVVEGRDLDKRGIEDKAREFGRKLDQASLALFFYAGHGLQVGGKNYLVPVDAKLERAGDLTFEAIDVAQILAQMEAEQRVNLVFLDACRDNPLARTLARSLGTRSATVGQGLATIQSAVGTMIAYATQPDNVALDGEGRNSPFTTALLKHIGTQGLEISSLMKRVRADVIQATRGKQVPWDHSSLIGDVVLTR